jgi:hypothetical protein
MVDARKEVPVYLIAGHDFVEETVNIITRTRGSMDRRKFLYAVRVLQPAAFRLPDGISMDDLVPGTEVGSLVHEDLYSASRGSLTRSLEVLSRLSRIIELVFGGVGEEDRRKLFQIETR